MSHCLTSGILTDFAEIKFGNDGTGDDKEIKSQSNQYAECIITSFHNTILGRLAYVNIEISFHGPENPYLVLI